MSESAATIIKIISALTSPKACIKYITIGGFYFSFLVYIKPMMPNDGITPQQKQFIILMIGLGVGSLVGHLISEFIYFLLGLYRKAKEKKTSDLEIKKLEQDKLEEKEESDREILENIISSFLHLNANQKQTLRELVYRDLNLSLQEGDYQILLQNNYILKKSSTQKGSFVFSINPAIKSFIEEEWYKTRKNNINSFMLNPHAKELLSSLEVDNIEKAFSVNNQALTSISRYSNAIGGFFDKEPYAGDIVGFNLFFGWDYLPIFEDMFNKEYVDEVYIPAERITYT